MLIILLFNWERIADDPTGFLTAFIPYYCLFLVLLIPMLVFHEVSHGRVALWLGDDTAQKMGRLTLNPLAHLDRAGTMMFLIVGIGRAKPVPINPYRLSVDPRKGMAVVAAAGPLANILLAMVCSVPFRLDLLSIPVAGVFRIEDVPALALLMAIQISVLLAVFNLLPVPPFDGFRIAVGVLPKDQARAMASAERYAPQIIAVVFLLVLLTGFLWYVTDFFTNALIGQDVF